MNDLRLKLNDSENKLNMVLRDNRGKFKDKRIQEKVERIWEKLQDEWTQKRWEQQLRLWAGEVRNCYFSSDAGIRGQLLAFEDFLEVQIDNAETPELCRQMIQSNYLGGLAFTYSKLPARLEKIGSVVLEKDTKIREEQLGFLGWTPLLPLILNAREQLGAQRQKLYDTERFKNKWYRDEYEEKTKMIEVQIEQVKNIWEENLERAGNWQVKSGSYDIRKEQDLFGHITTLMESELFGQLRNPEIPLDALIEGCQTFLEQAHSHLLDQPFAQPEEN